MQAYGYGHPSAEIETLTWLSYPQLVLLNVIYEIRCWK